MREVNGELQQLLEQADGGPVGPPDLAAIGRRSRRLRATRTATMAAAVVVLVVGVGVGLAQTLGGPSAPVIGEGDEHPEGRPDTVDWEVLPTPPYRSMQGHSLVSTGEQLLLFGGVISPGDFYPGGAALDPDTGAWDELPAPPIEGRHGHVAVWTGQEMLIYGGEATTVADNDAGAGYDPSTGRWRPLASFRPLLSPQGLWTGEQLLVYGTPPSGGNDPTPPAVLGVYDPDTDQWTEAAASPRPARFGQTLVWTGDELIVWGGTSSGDDPAESSGSHGIAYNPTTDTWRDLPDAPLEPRLLHTAVWTSDRMIVWGGTAHLAETDRELADGAAYDPATDTWTELPAAPLSPRANHLAAAIEGKITIAGGNRRTGGSSWSATTDGATFDPDTGTWEHLDTLSRDLTNAAWTTAGEDLIAIVPDTEDTSTLRLTPSHLPDQ